MTTWTWLKQIIDARDLYVQYSEDNTNYYIKAYDNSVLLQKCIINKSVQKEDKDDFENNYKSLANLVMISKMMINDGIDSVGISNGRLKTESIPSSSTTNIPILKNVKYDDMNASNGGVARDTNITTSYSTIYNYSGIGALIGFTVTFEGNLLGADPFIIKLSIDSNTVFELNTLDIGTQSLYNFDESQDSQILGIRVYENTFVFKSPMNSSIKYNSNLNVQIKKASGSSKRFRAGLVVLTKE